MKEKGNIFEHKDRPYYDKAQVYVNQQVTNYIIAFWCVVGVALLCIAIL